MVRNGPWEGLGQVVSTARQARLTPPKGPEGIRQNDLDVNTLIMGWQCLKTGPASTYVRPFVRRKRLLCMLIEDGQGHKFWDDMSIKQLSELVPDQGGHLPVESRLTAPKLTAFLVSTRRWARSYYP